LATRGWDDIVKPATLLLALLGMASLGCLALR
jgi:hypothetical protein